MITRTFSVICVALILVSFVSVITTETSAEKFEEIHENSNSSSYDGGEIVSIYNASYPSEVEDSLSSNVDGETLVNLRKCCPLNQVIRGNSGEEATSSHECITVTPTQEWNPQVYSTPEIELTSGERDNISWTIDIAGFPNCSYILLDNRLDKWFNILTDGSTPVGLNYWSIPAWLKPLGTNYCVDSIQYGDTLVDTNDERNYALVFCELENFHLYLTLRISFATLYMISSLSIALALTIYLLIWEHHSIPGWTQFSFLLSFFLFYTTEGSRIFAKANGLNIVPTKACFVHAIIAHYFTTVVSGTALMLSIDCFVTFWKLRSTKRRGRKELAFYLISAWGIPLIAFVTGLYLHFRNNPAEAEKQMSGVFEYAHYRCSSPIWEFTFNVQLVILLLNLSAFIGTAFLIFKHFRSAAFANHTDSDKAWKQFKKSFILYMKLFLMMGISWSISAIDLFLGYKHTLEWKFVLVRGYLSIQGVIYFVLFGLHRKNFRLLQKKYPGIQRVPLIGWICKIKTRGGSSKASSSL